MADSSQGSPPGNLPFADDSVSKAPVPNPFSASMDDVSQKGKSSGGEQKQTSQNKKPLPKALKKKSPSLPKKQDVKAVSGDGKTGPLSGNFQLQKKDLAKGTSGTQKPMKPSSQSAVPASKRPAPKQPQAKTNSKPVPAPMPTTDPVPKPVTEAKSMFKPANKTVETGQTEVKKQSGKQGLSNDLQANSSVKKSEDDVQAALSKIASIDDQKIEKEEKKEKPPQPLDVTKASPSPFADEIKTDEIQEPKAEIPLAENEEESAGDSGGLSVGPGIPQPFSGSADGNLDMPFDSADEGEEFLKSLGDVDLGGSDKRAQIIRIVSAVVVVLVVVGLVIFGVYAFNRWVRPSLSGLTNGDNNQQVDTSNTNTNQNTQDEFDADGDGLPDEWELQYGLAPDDGDDAFDDNDFDQLKNTDEYRYGTSPINPDTDGDTFRDGVEVQRGYNPAGEGKLPEFDESLKKAENLRDVVAQWNGIMNGKNLSSQDMEFFMEDTGEIIGTFNLQNLEGEQIFSRGKGEFTYNKNTRLFTADLSVKGFRNQEGIDYTLVITGLVQPDLNKITGTWTLIPSREVPWLLRDRGTFQLTK